MPPTPGRLSEAEGTIPFDRFMEWALYEPGHGFFATGGGAGRRGGDFITSPEVGPLFGAVVANWLDAVWDSLAQPDPFTVIEVGAGRGALAIAVRAAAPRCAGVLDYALVERAEELRRRHGEHLELSVDRPSAPLAGAGPVFRSHSEEPAGGGTAVVLANELLDNMAFRLAERTAAGWSEVVVRLDADGAPAQQLVALPAPDARRCEELAPEARPGARIPLQEHAAAWVAHVLAGLRDGRLLVVDYCATTAELARRPQGSWLRTYRGHDRGGDPLDRPGSQDITAEVALDQLPGGFHLSSQREWLAANGIARLVEEARQEWERSAAVGDLRAMRARSAPIEAEALCDPAGLGAFRVLEWRPEATGEK